MTRPIGRNKLPNIHLQRPAKSRLDAKATNHPLTGAIKLIAAAIFCGILYQQFYHPAASLENREFTHTIPVPVIDNSNSYSQHHEFGPQLTSTLQCILSKPFSEYNDEQRGTLHIIKNPVLRYADNQKTPVAELENYLKHVTGLTPKHASPLTRFPENLSAFLLYEYILTGHGESACKLDIPQLVNTGDCNTLLVIIERYLQAHPDEKKKMISKAPIDGKGFTASINIPDRGKYTARIGIAPKLHANYHRAIKEMEKWLQDPCFLERPRAEIEASVIFIHNLLVGESEEGKTGYRDKELVRNKWGKEVKEADMKKLSELLSFDEPRPSLIKEARKNNRWSETDRVADILTPEQLSLLKETIHVPSRMTLISQHMLEFIDKLKFYAARGVHTVALAAWAHVQLVDIAPFLESPDEFALLFTNYLLLSGGYDAVVVHDEEAYLKAISEEVESPGHFSYYLASLIKRQAEGLPMLSS